MVSMSEFARQNGRLKATTDNVPISRRLGRAIDDAAKEAAIIQRESFMVGYSINIEVNSCVIL